MKGCRPLTRKETKAVLKATDSLRDNALLTLGFRTGYRISELLSLRICDVATPEGVIFDELYVEGKNTKTSEGRAMFINSDAKKAVKRLVLSLLKKGHQMTAPLFSGRKHTGKAISRQQAWRLLKELFEKAKVVGGKLATHTLRKTFAARVKKELRGDLPKLQKALGHKSITSTIAYITFSEKRVKQAILRFEL